ncbi:hypothetical protein OG393_03310 [Streptomyces sp. NBC_01216]|uniref:hypothetical protein n=1 Tax=Streptomyces sp. NBC_01216 TaxID=2903778 RepID=UPI002E114F2D|nr:hypothetical protein OG393_03310 [Streptomyces sp. NBC_01216]
MSQPPVNDASDLSDEAGVGLTDVGRGVTGVAMTMKGQSHLIDFGVRLIVKADRLGVEHAECGLAHGHLLRRVGPVAVTSRKPLGELIRYAVNLSCVVKVVKDRF